MNLRRQKPESKISSDVLRAVEPGVMKIECCHPPFCGLSRRDAHPRAPIAICSRVIVDAEFTATAHILHFHHGIATAHPFESRIDGKVSVMVVVVGVVGARMEEPTYLTTEDYWCMWTIVPVQQL